MRPGRIAAWVIGVLITGLYAYAVVAAVGNLLGMLEQAEIQGLGFSPLGWGLLITGLVVPVAVFVLALLFGRGRGPALRVLLLATGLALVAVIQLDVLDLITRVVPPATLYEALL